MLLLNASGCLDALTAPEVGALARRVRDEDGDARAARRATRRCASPRPTPGCSTRSGSRTRAASASSAETLPRLRALGVPLWVSVGGFSAARLRRDLRAARRERHGHRAQPLVPERRRGARVGGRDRRRVPGGDRPAALREALAGRVGHRRGRAGGRGGRRRRPLARQHDPRPRARRAAAADARAGDGRLLGAGAEADRARRRVRLPARDGSCRSSAWAASDRARRARAGRLRRDPRRARNGALRRPRRAGAGPRGARRGARAGRFRQRSRTPFAPLTKPLSTSDN